MESIDKFVQIIESASRIATENFSNADSIAKAESTKNTLVNDMRHDSYIKVPFVGDFSAGKSSLINSYMGVNLLPTDVAPQTAVSYELYYSKNEKLDVYHNGSLKLSTSLGEIANLDVVPGDIVKVFIDNDPVRKLNEANIVIVDMPGIDSGIEAHNNAIMNYIAEGTHFIIVMECTTGSFRNSSISFIQEIKKYGLSLSVLLSKADKLPEQELNNNKSFIEAQAKSIIDESVTVGVTSAAENFHSDLDKVLASINANEYIDKKYKARVQAYIENIISELRLQMKLLLSDTDNLSKQIEQIKAEKASAMVSLEEKSKEAQDVSMSADDILNDVRNALLSKADYLANIIFSSKNDQKILTDEIMHIIRPVLIESFKREIGEYQETIGTSIVNFSVKVDAIINDSDNVLYQGAQEIYNKVFDTATVEGLVKTGFDKLTDMLSNYKAFSVLLTSLGRVLGPVLVIAVNFVPDLIRAIFGKSDQKKKDEIAAKLTGEAIPKIVESLRNDVEKMLTEQRTEAMEKMQELLNEESKKYDDNINEMMNRQKENAQEREAKIKSLSAQVEILESSLTSL